MNDARSPSVPPREAVDTLFLDVGNTLISMDFDWIAGVLAEAGLYVPAEAVRRAEAAARPETSRRLHIMMSFNLQVYLYHGAMILSTGYHNVKILTA